MNWKNAAILLNLFVLLGCSSFEKHNKEKEKSETNVFEGGFSESDPQVPWMERIIVAIEALDTDVPQLPDKGNVNKRKEAFFSFLKPVVIHENQRILQQRRTILSYLDKFKKNDSLSTDKQKELQDLAKKYRVKNRDFSSSIDFQALLMKVDVIPVKLALVQAANESNWGRSYFAKKGNNLFGEWCFQKGCGIVPRRRSEGSTHEVATYADINHSVRSYLRNLNSHPAYHQLRAIRYQMRKRGEKPSAAAMAEGLKNYAGIKGEYVIRLKNMLRTNEALLAKVLNSPRKDTSEVIP